MKMRIASNVKFFECALEALNGKSSAICMACHRQNTGSQNILGNDLQVAQMVINKK